MSLAPWILIVINAVIALSDETPGSFRLPDSVVPFHYKLKILTKLTDDFSYNGKVWIDVEALSDVNRIVVNAKNLKIYDNETTVEELSMAALENIFNGNLGKHTSSKKKIKRSAESEETTTAKQSVTTEKVMTAEQKTEAVSASAKDGAVPHLPGIDIKDVKVTNRRPGNSPIKYIYYTLQKPGSGTVSDQTSETKVTKPEFQSTDKGVTKWMVKGQPEMAASVGEKHETPSATEKASEGYPSTEKFVTRWVVKDRPDAVVMDNGKDKMSATTEKILEGHPSTEKFVTRWVVKGRPEMFVMNPGKDEASSTSTEKVTVSHPMTEQFTKWVVKGRPEMVLVDTNKDGVSASTEKITQSHPMTDHVITKWVVKGRPEMVIMNGASDEQTPTETISEANPEKVITKWIVKGKPELVVVSAGDDKTSSTTENAEGFPSTEKYVTRWVVKGRPEMDTIKDDSVTFTEKMPASHPMPQHMITKWVVKGQPEDATEDGTSMSAEKVTEFHQMSTHELSTVAPVIKESEIITPGLQEETSMKVTTPAIQTEGLNSGDSLMNHHTTSSNSAPELQTSPPPHHASHPSTEHPVDEESAQPKPVSHEFDPENNLVVINLSSPLKTGKKYRIQFRFRGVLSDSLTGFHRVSYRKRNSKKVSWLASTVFEPNEARSAFPCFDEPNFKATFDIALAHDKKYTALSNMPVKGVSPVDGRSDYQWTMFERTPKMSTYLVAFLISDLQHLSPKLTPKEGVANTTYRFWARQDVLHRTRYAAKIVPDMKNYLEKLLGVPDVMPKYDFVALPSFVSNALENWGLVSFAEKNILYTPGFSSVFSKFETTQILGHEVSHIWFGNLVTPRYWDQIWLSEGFSNYFEVVVADHVQPTWDVKTISLVFAYLKVFSVDAMHSSHPLVPQIKNLHDVNEIFDSISYQKGYFMVRMLNYTLGEETFLKGVRHYLTNNRLSNADENDLWDALTLYGHTDGTLPEEYHLKHIMESWTRRTGYPVIDVFRDYDNQTAVVTQRRFLRPKFDLELRTNLFADDEQEETKWWIPLTYTTGKELNFQDTKPKVWMKPEEDETLLKDMPEDNQFVLMNIEASGLYRVNYDERNWELLINLLLSENYTDISIINRVQILDDLLDFARAGEMSYATAFDAANYLKKEKNFLPWRAALSNFEYISRMFRSTDSNRLFKKFVRSLVSDRFDELGLEPRKNENIMDSMNRKQIVKWACMTGHRQCTRKSLSLFRKWTEEKKPDENNPIPSSIRSVVYCTATAHGGAKDWQFLWNRYVNNIDVSDKMAIISGLGCTRNTRTLRKYLDWSLSESSGLRKQDSVSVFKSVARNDIGFNIAKEFFTTRIADIKNYLGSNPLHIPRMVESLASKMNQESHLQELEAIEDEHFTKLRAAPRSFKQAKERVTFNIDWLDQNYDQITDWLKKQRF